MGRISYTGALLLKALFSSTVCCCRALYLGSSETRVYIPQALWVSVHVTIEVKPGALWLWALLFKMLYSTVQ